MLYLVLQPVTFAGVNYEPGDVIDLGDLEQATQMLRAARGAVIETTAAAAQVQATPPAPVAPVVPLPQPELRQAPKSKASKARR